MTQLYSFIDQNGETRLLAAVSPDILNGGTISGVVTIEDVASSVPNGLLIVDGHVVVDLTAAASDTRGIDVYGRSGSNNELLRLIPSSGFDALAVYQTAGKSAGAQITSFDNGSPVLYLDHEGNAPTANVLSIAPGGSVKAGFNATGQLFTVPPAPATVQLVSTTAAQISTTADKDTMTPFTTDGTANDGTCLVELSADNITFATLVTVTASAAVNTVGAIVFPINLRVPRNWYVKMTTAHGTLGVTTYW